MRDHVTNQFPVEQLQVEHATAKQSPIPGLVRLQLDVTPDEAHRIAYACDGRLAGFAGLLEISALWARYGVSPDQPAGILPQRRASDPGE